MRLIDKLGDETLNIDKLLTIHKNVQILNDNSISYYNELIIKEKYCG